MKNWGFRYKRMRKICGKRDETLFEVFKEELEALKKMEDKGEIALYFYDEMGINLEPSVPYGWQPKGQTKGIPSQKSPNISTMGFLNRDNTFWGFQTDGSTNSALIIACFDAFVEKINALEETKPQLLLLIMHQPTHQASC